MKQALKKRTQFTLLVEIFEQLGGPAMKEKFFRELAPVIWATTDRKALATEMSEGEYQEYVAHIREEMPAFRRYLLSWPTNRPTKYSE